MKTTPTLFIALGGTGAEIALRLRRRILTHAWGYDDNPVCLDGLDDFPLAQFIYYDLDASSYLEGGKAAASDPLANLVRFSAEEQLTLKLDWNRYLRTEDELDRYPLIEEWFPLSRKKVLELNIDPTNMKGPSRFLSRLYFFDKYPVLKYLMRNKLESLLIGISSRSASDRLGLITEPESLRVVVLASTAGGTGSGAFLDMGYLCKHLANRVSMGGAVVDLMLMLPGGYRGHAKTRCEANTYAALMELETCMRPGPGFVKGWNSDEFAELPAKPYDNVFLFETVNLAEKKTARVTDTFDMVADIMFDDFLSSEFSSHKRSVKVNQLQHTIRPFTLPVNAEKFGDMKMNYSKAYCSCGMATIDTGLEHLRHEIASEHVCEMLKVFFGVSSDSSCSREITSPTSDDGFDLLREQAYCGKGNFKLAYHFAFDDAPFQEGVEFCILQLIDTLLYDEDGQSMQGQLRDRITVEINQILSLTAKDQRLPQVGKLLSNIDCLLGLSDGVTFSGTSIFEQKIMLRRDSIFHSMVDKNSGLFKTLWATVENKEKGGLNHTLQLIDRIKDCIKNDSTGLLRDIWIAQKWFAGLREELHNRELQVLREHFLQTKGGVLFKHHREVFAEAKLQQMGEAICWYAEARLREVACKEAAWLLQELSSWLGDYQGFDEQSNRKRWSNDSFAGELVCYEKIVLDIISGLNEKAAPVRDDIEFGNPMIHVVKASNCELEAVRNISQGMSMEMAKSVFDDLGGARAILERLMTNQSSAEIIGQLHNLALSRLPVLGRGDENPLLKALDDLDSTERRVLFQNCLESAMPWIDAKTEGFWTTNPYQYVCLVGVDGAQLFTQRFGDEFRSALVRSGMTSNQIHFLESGIPGKLTCYVELSGIPLTSLNPLPQWRESYKEENKKFPVHIHKDRSLFVHPLAPSAATLDRLAEHFKLFIQGIVLGVLKQRRNDSGDLDYCLTVSGEELSIGNERLMRLDGMVNEVQNIMQSKVANVLNQFNIPAQHAGLVALYDFYAQCVYPPAIVRHDGGMESSQESFPHVMCCKLGEEAKKKLKEKYPGEDIGLIVRLKGCSEEEPSDNFDALDIWTDLIEGSETDVYAYEVGKAHRPKRVMKTEFFQTSWLENCFQISVEKQEDSIKVVVPPKGNCSQSTSCSSCGEQVDGNPKFCPHCGNQMKSGKKCSGCGSTIEGNPKFCPECGTKQGSGLQCGNFNSPPPFSTVRQERKISVTRHYSIIPLEEIDLASLQEGHNCFLHRDSLRELVELSAEYKYFALLHENNFLMTMIKTDLGFVSNLPVSGGTFNYFLDKMYDGDVNDLSFYYYGGCGGTDNPYFSKKTEDYSYMVYVSRETRHILARDFGMKLLSKEDYMQCALATSDGYSWDINKFGSAPNGFYVPDKKEWALEGMFYNPMTLGYFSEFGLQGFEHAYVRLLVEG